MTQSAGSTSVVHPKYKLSVVSGGKPILPRNINRSSCNKAVTCLTHDKSSYIVPFNNQVKIYSIETRQCIKTIKFANNETLSSVFRSDEVVIVHIALGDASIVEETSNDKITIFTNTGHVVVLNYKGKLTESPKMWQISFADEQEKLFKVFQRDSVLKLLTVTNGSAACFTYKLYSFENKQTEYIKSYSNIILSTWSANDKYLCLLTKSSEGKKSLCIEPVFDGSASKEFPLPSTSSSTSTNANFVTTIAMDNNCEQVAVGFASGVINLISIGDLSNRLLKWHIDAVLSLCFTSDGSYLLSGGWEKVLSFWQLSTNLQQFLPRLNGVIIDCQVIDDKFYSLALQMTENTTSADYQLLLLNSTDLNSRLAINGPLPVFQTATKDVVQPLSAVSTRNSTSSNTLTVSKKKQQRKLLKKKRQDYTTHLEIHPLTKNLYFPHISAIQTYDFYKNEQVSYQYMASGVNNSMGKVRLELNLKDPIVSIVKFTKNGTWMITYEIEYPPQDLLSSHDLVHVLKFWNQDSNGEWVLKTKVLNPHGINVPVTDILAAPLSVNKSQGCLTSDNNGGLKYWSFQETANNWCLSKVSLPNFNHYSNSVALAWSRDGSLIFHAFDDKMTIIEFAHFGKFVGESDNNTLNELTLDSPIQSMKLINDTNLIVATHNTLNAVNLLLGTIVKSFDLYPYVNGVYKSGHLDRLIACDEKSGRIALVINQKLKSHDSKTELSYRSRVLIFNSDLSARLGVYTHNDYISCISWNYDTDFIFMDTQCRLGVVSTTTNTEIADEVNKEGALDSLDHNEFERQLQNLSKKTAEKEANNVATDGEDEIALEFINGDKNDKLINMNSFTSMFENIDNVQMDTLFDRVMRVVS